MTHLPYILSAYGLTALVAVALSFGAVSRLRSARKRLAQLDPRAR